MKKVVRQIHPTPLQIWEHDRPSMTILNNGSHSFSENSLKSFLKFITSELPLPEEIKIMISVEAIHDSAWRKETTSRRLDAEIPLDLLYDWYHTFIEEVDIGTYARRLRAAGGKKLNRRVKPEGCEETAVYDISGIYSRVDGRIFNHYKRMIDEEFNFRYPRSENEKPL